MSERVFDRAALLARLMNDDQFARDVVRAFLSDIPSQLQGLERALAAGDAASAGRRAHTIKGASATMACEALRAAAEAAEDDCRRGALAHAAADLPALRAHFEEVQHAMRAYADIPA